MILYSETAPFQIGNPSDETVLVDVIAFDPAFNLRVGDTLWASGSGVAEGVERGFLAYHSGPKAKAAVTEGEVRQKRKYTRRVPLATATTDAHNAAAKGGQ